MKVDALARVCSPEPPTRQYRINCSRLRLAAVEVARRNAVGLIGVFARHSMTPGGEHTRMRIAQVAPLAEAVPPGLYGGTERVVSWLTEELVRQGDDVTLF